MQCPARAGLTNVLFVIVEILGGDWGEIVLA